MMHHGPNIYVTPHCSCSCGRLCTGESNILMKYENQGSKNVRTILPFFSPRRCGVGKTCMKPTPQSSTAHS